MILIYNQSPIVGAKVLAEQTETNRAAASERGQSTFKKWHL